MDGEKEYRFIFFDVPNPNYIEDRSRLNGNDESYIIYKAVEAEDIILSLSRRLTLLKFS
jgi:hypothetical protein